MTKLDDDYKSIILETLDDSLITKKTAPNGDHTRSIFGRTIVHDCSDFFPILTLKKVAFKSALAEFLWMWNGRRDYQFLIDNKCKIWDDYFEENPEAFFTYQDVRSWQGSPEVDQLRYVVDTLKKTPKVRHACLSNWNPSVIYGMATDNGRRSVTLAPCVYNFVIFSIDRDDKLDVSFTSRSQDLPIGTPFNLISAGLLINVVASILDLKPGKLVWNMGDCHIYGSQLEAVKEFVQLTPYETKAQLVFPKLSSLDDFKELTVKEFKLEGYVSNTVFRFPYNKGSF